MVGIIGANGAGKTTVFDSISGFVSPTSGVIRFEGTDVTQLGADARAALGLGRSFQDARLFPAMTVRRDDRNGARPSCEGARSGVGVRDVARGPGVRKGDPLEGGRPDRAPPPRGVRGQVRRRAVDRHAADRRHRLLPRARPERPAAGRTVVRPRSARDGSPRPGDPRHPRPDRARHSSSSSTTSRSSRQSRTSSSRSTWG